MSAKTANIALDSLIQHIIESQYPDGARLPSERKLCQQFQISRASLRELLSVLQSWNIVRSKKGSGIEVFSKDNWHINIVPYYLKYGKKDVFYIKLIQELLAIRRKLLIDVFEMCPKRKLDLSSAKISAQKAWENKEEIKEFAAHEIQTIHHICQSAELYGSLWLWNTFGNLYMEVVSLLPIPIKIPEDYLKLSLRMLTALERGETLRATTLLKRIMKKTEDPLLKFLSQLKKSL